MIYQVLVELDLESVEPGHHRHAYEDDADYQQKELLLSHGMLPSGVNNLRLDAATGPVAFRVLPAAAQMPERHPRYKGLASRGCRRASRHTKELPQEGQVGSLVPLTRVAMSSGDVPQTITFTSLSTVVPSDS